ncbi:hypothetical protein COU57_04365 [Candidatus Pacearchaeota archaeon CG10_big_fil_rev_8_21_14_0_10_32_14]|nr:MAG: hypothetical protein COU57_04365 [Candidatus Pacearchaeota archaeon CG10_big_fil_rev_8_21_14_0_10_32_14]
MKKEYPSVNYCLIKDYEQIKNKINKDSHVINIDFSSFKDLSEFKEFLRSIIDVPQHYLNNLDSLQDLFFELPYFVKNKKIIVLLKNYNQLMVLNKYYYDNFIDILACASKFLEDNKEGDLKTFVFVEGNKQMKKLIDYQSKLIKKG